MENYGKIDPETGLSTRLLDFLRSFDFLVDYALEHKVNAVLFSGDAYKNREPNPTQQREFAKRILRLAKNGIPVVLLVGNHDTPNVEAKANTLDIYSTLELPNIFVIRTPQLITVPLTDCETFQSLQIIGLPWLSKRDFELLPDTLRSFYEKIAPDSPAITLYHGTVEGSAYGSERALTLGKDPVVPLSLLTSTLVSYVGLGHIHKRQILSENPPVLYPGSIERVDFGEEKEEKGFEVVEIDAKKKATHRCILTPARKFITINCTLTEESLDPTEEVLQSIVKTEIEASVVKIVLTISQENLERLRIPDIKKAVEARAYALAGITKNVERSLRQRLEGVSAEELSPIEALQKYFEVKQYSESRIKTLEQYGRELIEGLIRKE